MEERQFQPSTPEHLKEFIRILEQQGVNVTVRRRLGSDVDASCGQLRRKMQKIREEEVKRMKSFGLTDKGKVRQNNQDCFILEKCPARNCLIIRTLRRDGRRQGRRDRKPARHQSICLLCLL